MAFSQLITTSLLLLVTASGYVATEELPELPTGCLSSEDQGYTAGDITGAVVGTLLVTLALLAIGYALYRMYWRGRRGKHLVLSTDPEGGGVSDDYAFDNPCFRDGTPIGRGGYEKEPVKLDHKNRWSAWSPLGAIVGTRNEKRRALDDSFTGEPQVSVVALRSHDFTGLGFNVCGNMRDGIYVKDVLHRGPASESGQIAPGDRIDSIRISFRHMVFEDALTILSYASPYEVQLEVENPLPSSRPSTLIRAKKSSIEPADRICHPFYRSQSIADLAEIGKSNLKMGQDAGSKSPRAKSDLWDESRAGEYPTLKLSPSPTKQTVKLEKTAASPSVPSLAAIVKPERARKVPPKDKPHDKPNTPTEETAIKDAKTDSTGKHQKFGIRVLPDPKSMPQLKNVSADVKLPPGPSAKPDGRENVIKPRPASSVDKTSTVLEAERRENERNSMVEQTGAAFLPTKATRSTSTDSSARDAVDSSLYDERGIDVGPAEEEENRRKASLGEAVTKPDVAVAQHDGHTNVKHLLTKGFQNLKEKLHPHDKKKSASPEPATEVNLDPSQFKKVSVKAVKRGKTSESSDSDGTADNAEPASSVTAEIGEKEAHRDEGEIPTEMPEEMHRAAMAARNNRRSSGYIPPETQVLSVGPEADNPASDEAPRAATVPGADGANYPPVKYRVRQRESLSEDSSGDDLGAGTSGSNDTDSIGTAPKRSHKRKAPIPPSDDTAGPDAAANPQRNVESDRSVDREISDPNPSDAPQENTNEGDNIQTMEVRINTGNLPAFVDIPKQQNSNDVTNIAVESSSAPSPDSAVGSGDLKIVVDNPSNKTEHDSDSDDQDTLTSGKKGGTTIELNSSHITIHHSPSSDTVTLELDNDSTRKAASMGDLSRLDSEQPMSVLERAVSLDLADGGTPHSSKKRKAPLPPPGDEFLNAVQDGDDGGLYRKEPRLDNALDTFQRRRLKKSSDWGTMEDAVQQDPGSPVTNVRRSLASPTNILVGAMDDEPTSLTISIGEEDADVFIESKPQQVVCLKEEVKVPVASVRTKDLPGRAYLFPGGDTDVTDVNLFGGEDGPQRAVWRITPAASQVTVAHSSGPASLEPTTSHVTIGTTSLIADRQEAKSSHVTVGLSGEPRNNVDTMSTSHVTIGETSGPSSLAADRLEPNVDTITTSQVTIGQSSNQSNLIPGEQELKNTFAVVTTSHVTIPPSSLVSSGDSLARSTSPDDDAEIRGSRLFSFIQGEYQKSSQRPDTSRGSEQHTIVSSTPIAKRDRLVETIQSPQVTSSDARKLNVVSSTTRSRQQVPSDKRFNISAPSPNVSVDSTVDDSSVSISSTSEPFLTAASVVDSTTTFVGNVDEDDSTWGQDSQPPELPTSPVPILTSVYNPSSSMTYITEIQVTTLTPNKLTATQTFNGSPKERETTGSTVVTSNEPASISPDSMMGSETEDSEMEGNDRAPTQNGSSEHQRNNVTVTAIRNASASNDRSRIPMRVGNEAPITLFQSVERSQIPLRTDGLLTTFHQGHASGVSMEQSPVRSEGIMTTFQNNSNVSNSERSHIPMRIVTTVLKETSPTGNGIGEKKGKAVRPPVPPRKSDSSMSSVVNVDVLNRSSENAHSFTSQGTSPKVQTNSSGKKFISFSSLTPRPVSAEGTGRNSSFEQWVFLDETQGHATNGGSHNGQDVEDESHSTVVTLANRPPSVTHIVLDSKQSSGKRGSP